MSPNLVDALTRRATQARDAPLDSLLAGLDLPALLAATHELDGFIRASANLYERVRALACLASLQREHLLPRLQGAPPGRVPEGPRAQLLTRAFREAIDGFLADQRAVGPNEANASGLAAAARGLCFQSLAAEVRRSVECRPENRWMFAPRRPADAHPLALVPELRDGAGRALVESTPVRLDLSHSAWSDIFFLAMDDPAGARVLNISVDLAPAGQAPRPPVEATLALLDRPVLRLESVDLGASAELTTVAQVFDFGADHLGLLRAAVVASGLVPPGLEAAGGPLAPLLQRVLGPGRGLLLRSAVHAIPKGSRLAVSTTLLAALLAVLARATGQTAALTGPLDESTRRLLCGRAILGEWLGGSGGGWQDSGGLWPGVKLIEGVAAVPGDVEHGSSAGCLLPRHRVLTPAELSPAARQALCSGLVLVHGGLAADVGPILELVTERYLLRSEPAWSARRVARGLFDEIHGALRAGDLLRLGAATQANFEGPIRAIVPGAADAFSVALIGELARRCSGDFLGFWMLGGMAGGGMGLLFRPAARPACLPIVAEVLAGLCARLRDGLPFAIEPLIYDFAINDRGSVAELREGPAAAHTLVTSGARDGTAPSRSPADPASRAAGPVPPRKVAASAAAPAVASAAAAPAAATSAGSTAPAAAAATTAPSGRGAALDALLARHGFDERRHEALRQALRAGRIGLRANRLPTSTVIEDARPGDVLDLRGEPSADLVRSGEAALRRGEVALVTLAGGVGSRWTRGAGTVKALCPFVELGGAHRSFLDIHRARAAATARRFAAPLHVVTTGHLTQDALGRWAAALGTGAPRLSHGARIGLRFVPTLSDLRFAWREQARPQREAEAQRLRHGEEDAAMAWAAARGEASDYVQEREQLCVHPPGHAGELPNLLRNGTLARLLAERPALTTLFVHNVDSVGAGLDPAVLASHRASGAALSFELTPRRVEDQGGALARVDGRLRLVEALALPREEDELSLSHASSMSTWVEIDPFLALLGLTRAALADGPRVEAAADACLARLPAYVVLKDVRERRGGGHEDVLPVLQVEQLWGDVTTLPEARVAYLLVPTRRGRQLKEPGQLDAWLRDGSAAWVASGCGW